LNSESFEEFAASNWLAALGFPHSQHVYHVKPAQIFRLYRLNQLEIEGIDVGTRVVVFPFGRPWYVGGEMSNLANP
jgi:hypothetical protein